MDNALQHALEEDKLIDITTTGRKTGKTYRKEVWLHYLDGRVIIVGAPGPRSWYANLLANPEITIHVKQSVQRDLQAQATPITDPARRRELFTKLWDMDERVRHTSVEERIARSALVEVDLGA